MRIDHHAYQRATQVAAFGLLMQATIGLTLVVFGLLAKDSLFLFASAYAVIGIFIWLGLSITFHQHKLERLEALEEDEIATEHGATSSAFEQSLEEARVAARRLAMMHKWFLPILSLVITTLLAGTGFWLLRFLQSVKTEEVVFHRTEERGWAVAICLGIAAVSFVFSRFVAGMAKQEAWQNLRGGASYTVGNSLVLIAVAIGIICRFFEREGAITIVAYAIPVCMSLLALEMAANFVLHLYRPRIPGEVPRPAFDSKFLSFFATPDSIVRSLNDAVNYQFGFDVTSSWGYQLLLRSLSALAILGIGVLILLSTMVVVEPHQQAVKLRGGQIVESRVYESGIMWKWPWPFETAQIFDVSRIRSLHLTAQVLDDPNKPLVDRVFLWSDSEPPRTDAKIEPFLVASTQSRVTSFIPKARSAMESSAELDAEVDSISDSETEEENARTQQILGDSFSLIDAEIVLQYRINTDDPANGLIQYLQFAPELVSRRYKLTDRERAIRAIASGQVSAHLSQLPLNHVLAPGKNELANNLRSHIQSALDTHKTGVQVVSVDLPMIRPSGRTAPTFEELDVTRQVRKELIALIERHTSNQFARLLGDNDLLQPVLRGIDEFEDLKRTHGSNSPEVISKRQEIEDLLMKGGGEAAEIIINAETERWVTLMDKRSQATQLLGQLAAYRAAPELYRQREMMGVLKSYLPVINKYIVAIDPSRLKIDFDLKSVNPILDFAGASEEEFTDQ